MLWIIMTDNVSADIHTYLIKRGISNNELVNARELTRKIENTYNQGRNQEAYHE
jgi:hypothetical protein